MMFMPGVVPDYLPPTVISLIDIIGLNAALTLVEERGGVFLYVPGIVKADHWLVEKIGLEATEKLAAVYPGSQLLIPRCHVALRALRENEIMTAIEQGVSNVQLAQKYGYTDRGIRKLRRRVEERGDYVSPQQDLF